MPAARTWSQFWYTTVPGLDVGVVAIDFGDVGVELGTSVGVGVIVGDGVGVDVDVDVEAGVDAAGVVDCTSTLLGVSVTCVGECVARGTGGREDGAYTGAVLVDSLAPNGYASTSVISATGTTMTASAVVRRGPPYLPIGPRTGLPCLSTQNAQRAGGAGQSSGGCHRRGGSQSGRGGAGHSGGVLNCLTQNPPSKAA